MSTIRERDAEGGPEKVPASWQGTIPWAIEDRRALLTAGDALADAADEVGWPWRNLPDPVASPMTRLLAAIMAWKETTG